MAYEKDRAWKKPTMREQKMAKGLLPSPWVMRLAGENITRRIYEDWNAFRRGHPVNLIVKIGNEQRTITRAALDAALAAAEQEHAEWRLRHAANKGTKR